MVGGEADSSSGPLLQHGGAGGGRATAGGVGIGPQVPIPPSHTPILGPLLECDYGEPRRLSPSPLRQAAAPSGPDTRGAASTRLGWRRIRRLLLGLGLKIMRL